MPEHYKCLLIDDDADDRMIFSLALKRINRDVELKTAEGGIQAIELLEKDPKYNPDFIFLDLNMPVMSGFECMDKIKKIAHLSNSKIIIYTTSSDEKDKQKAITLGADRFVTKPFDINDLVALLNEIFAGEPKEA